MDTQRFLSSEGTIRRQFEELEEKITEQFHSILAAVIVLGLLIIVGLVVGFVIVGLQGRNISKIKSEVEDVWSSNRQIKNEVWEVKECTEQIKANFSEFEANFTMDVEEAVMTVLDDFFPQPLPVSRILCDHNGNIDLPASTNVLISSNLTNTDMFTTTSTGYDADTGQILIQSPQITDDQVVIVQFQVRVFISSIDEDGTYSLILSTSDDCEFNNCPNGFYSTTVRFLVDSPEFSENGIWIELNTKIPIQTEQTYYVFLRSNSGSGIVIGSESGDLTACSALYISIEPVTSMFLLPT